MRTSSEAERKTATSRPRRAAQVTQQRGVVVALSPWDRERSQGPGSEGAQKACTFTVDTGDESFEAVKAMSCLIEPVVGDLVLLAVGDDGRSHVLAVLEREEGTKAQLAFDRDVTLKVQRGRFIIAAQEGIDLASPKDVSITSAGVRISAAEGSVTVDRLSYLGRLVNAEVERVKHVGAVFDSVIERVSQRLKRSFRTVEEIDQVRADQIDYSARQNLHFHGKNAIVTAEELVKMDGEQIHLG